MTLSNKTIEKKYLWLYDVCLFILFMFLADSNANMLVIVVYVTGEQSPLFYNDNTFITHSAKLIGTRNSGTLVFWYVLPCQFRSTPAFELEQATGFVCDFNKQFVFWSVSYICQLIKCHLWYTQQWPAHLCLNLPECTIKKYVKHCFRSNCI